MKRRIVKAGALLAAGVVSLTLVTLAQAGQAAACTNPPGSNVYCWPGPAPVPHRP